MHLHSVLFLLLSLTLHLTAVIGDVKLPENYGGHSIASADKQTNEKIPVIDANGAGKKTVQSATILINAISDEHTHTATEMSVEKLPHGADDLMQSGALQRAFYVLLGGTALLLLFLGFRMYRLQKGGSKPNIMVRKYGVLTNRRDVEMLPLPLDEDDEDDTVFEVGGHRIENHS